MTQMEIVTHVYCPPGVDQYAEMLRWQWASLAMNPPPVPTLFTVFFSTEDDSTSRVVGQLSKEYALNVRFMPLGLPPEKLFRRAIGRNERALVTKAEVIWFTDVDYLFGANCLKDVWEHVAVDSGLCIPEKIHICKDTTGKYAHCPRPDHALGDQLLREGRAVKYPRLNPEYFKEKEVKQAIGGVQIVGGRLARSIGYLKDTKWVQPVSTEQGFRQCRGDAVWRRSNDLKSTRIPVRGLYRLRHSIDGRDYDSKGTKGDGKEMW